MKLLLTAVMLSVLAGCVVYDDGYYPRRGGDGWYSQDDDDDDDDRGRRHHRGPIDIAGFDVAEILPAGWLNALE